MGVSKISVIALAATVVCLGQSLNKEYIYAGPA
jgi:hypothetical protein